MDSGDEERNMDTHLGRDGGFITATHSTHTIGLTHGRQNIQNEQKKWLSPCLFQSVL